MSKNEPIPSRSLLAQAGKYTNCRIMVIGDHADHVEALRMAAEQAGMEVVVPHTVAAAKHYLQAIDHIQVVVCHAYLSSGNVFELLRAVKENPALKKTQFMLVSCQTSELTQFFDASVKYAAEALGADKYVVMHQFDVNRLLREVQASLPVSTIC